MNDLSDLKRANVRCVALLLMLCLPWISGCTGDQGPERASVQGQISLNGKPLENGSIVLVPGNGVEGPTSGATIANGKFFIPKDTGPVLGVHRVKISATGKAPSSASPNAGGAASGPMAEGPKIIELIPPQYNERSDLTLDVRAGENEFNVDLKTTKK